MQRARAVAPALEWLRATADDGFPQYQLFRRDPYLDPIRNDPRFNTWLDDIRVRWQKYQELVPPR